jgi:hypothetical protein
VQIHAQSVTALVAGLRQVNSEINEFKSLKGVAANDQFVRVMQVCVFSL